MNCAIWVFLISFGHTLFYRKDVLCIKENIGCLTMDIKRKKEFVKKFTMKVSLGRIVYHNKLSKNEYNLKSA